MSATIAAHAGGAGEAVGWNANPVLLAAALVVAAAYARRAALLRAAGRGMPAWKQFSFYLGVTVLVLTLVSPLDSLGESRLFYAHMAQHLAMGELAPLLILLGLNGPMLRPLLAIAAVRRLRWALNPLVALPLWVINLYGWHLPVLYELALRNDLVHAVEHLSFFTAGMLMWGALIEPLPGPTWFGSGAKAVYVLTVRALGCAILGNILIWAGTPFYPYYRGGEAVSGIDPLIDQQIGGAIMLVWGAGITVLLFSWVFLRWLREAELRQKLLDAGDEERVATRAARFGRRAPALRRSPRSP